MNCVATIGFFDGVHRGHRYLLRELHREAELRQLASLVVTFRQHPRVVLGNAQSDFPPLLTTPQERELLITEQGIDRVLMLDFAEVRQLTAVQFLLLLREKYSVDVLLMGYDHRFGSDRLTSFADYLAAAQRAGVELVRIDEYKSQDVHVSSTVCRRLLLQGDVHSANRLLGYHYSLTGTVVHGKALGRQLGFPTANLQTDSVKLIPKDGVYEVSVAGVDDKIHKGLLNIGSNPTVGGTARTMEVHLLDFHGMLYGKTLTVSFLGFIRNEVKFRTKEELIRQIHSDLNFLNTKTIKNH